MFIANIPEFWQDDRVVSISESRTFPGGKINEQC